jgi:hypothetical protein
MTAPTAEQMDFAPGVASRACQDSTDEFFAIEFLPWVALLMERSRLLVDAERLHWQPPVGFR